LSLDCRVLGLPKLLKYDCVKDPASGVTGLQLQHPLIAIEGLLKVALLM